LCITPQAKVAGIKFSARTTLEVREWPQGLPDFAHFYDEMWDGQSRKERAKDYAKVKLERYRFPRPFAISKLPTRDITMQSVETDDGEFRMYQGVWRLQPLPGCVPEGQDAMRLTYAVEGTYDNEWMVLECVRRWAVLVLVDDCPDNTHSLYSLLQWWFVPYNHYSFAPSLFTRAAH
jgi:hypothetical protein